MKVFRPADRIYFGKHAGHALYEIYRFFPTYIEFLVEYVPGFIINESEFINLPRPMPYIAVFQLGEMRALKVLNANSITKTYQYLREGNSMPAFPFRFRKRTLHILNLKRKGLYKTPVWKKADALMVDCSIEDLLAPPYKLLN